MIPAIKILPQDVQHFTSSGYQLIIIAGSNDWQFALLNREKKLFEALIGFHFETKTDENNFDARWNETLNEYPFLNKYYSSVLVVYLHCEVALLPGADFNGMNIAPVLETLQGEEENIIIKTDFVTADNLQVVYGVSPVINNIIHRTYINVEIKHYYSRELMALAKSAYEDMLQVNFLGRHFSVCLMKQRKLQLLNLYEYSRPEDVLYYLLTIAKEFDCNREEINVIIGGMVDEKSALLDDLKKYFLNIQFAPRPEMVDCSPAFEEYPLHYFHTVFTIAACV